MNKSQMIMIALVCAGLLVVLVNFRLFTSATDQQDLSKVNEELMKLIVEQQVELKLLKSRQATSVTQPQEPSYQPPSRDITDLQRKVSALEQERDDLTKRNFDLARSLRVPESSSGTQEHPKAAVLRQKLAEYSVLHKKITTGELPPKYVKCVLINGWGNVLQEAVSCFMFGLVSGRAAIFDTGAIDGYMPFKKVYRAEDYPFDAYNVGVLKPLQERIIKRYELPCLDIETETKDDPFITIHLTYDFYAPSLMINPYVGEQLMEYLPDNWYPIVFQYLFTPNPEIRAAAEKFKKENFGGFTVGIQIRTPTLNKNGEKDHKGFPTPPVNLYAQTAELLSRFQKKAPYESAVWFVATQNIDLIHSMRNSYGNHKIVFYNGTISTTFESDTEGQKTAFLTWYLLGECDEVITTEVSSYGTTAAARTGVVPIVCNHKQYCFRRLSSTPCQDTPWLHEQPMECLDKIRKFPHQFLTAPDNSCGYEKYAIYISQEYQSQQKK